MAINQPPITGDPVLDAWLIEVTRELNTGQRGVAAAPTAEPAVTSVNEEGILRLNDGELFNIPVVTNTNINCYPVDVTDGTQATYEFMMLPDEVTEIPADSHMLFLSGLKLVCGTTRDYTVSGRTVTLSTSALNMMDQESLSGTVLELVTFNLT